MALIFAVLAWMFTLAPGRNHIEAATAIVSVVIEERALFKDDTDKMHTAALLTAIAFRESSIRNDVVSKTNDHCMMQINKRPDLARDPVACVRVAITMLRESMRACPAFPIAFYASGPGACENERAQRISRDRMAIAKRLLDAQRKIERERARADVASAFEDARDEPFAPWRLAGRSPRVRPAAWRWRGGMP